MTVSKRRVYDVLEGTRPSDRLSQAIQWFIITLIILNVTAVVLGTVQSLSEAYGTYFRSFEIFSVAVFTVEYLLRLWSCTAAPRFERPVVGRLRFMATPGALIDLAAILPFFLPRLLSVDLRAVRALRLFRLFRLAKLGRYSTSVTIFTDVLREKKEQMTLAFASVLVLLVLASSLMYFAERQAQPEDFANIPKAMWWGVVTLTTVGYGDVRPVTTVGLVLGGLISLMGIGLFALPAGILASGFEEALQRKQEQLHGDDEDDDDEADEAQDADEGSGDVPAEERRFCPCCGRRLEEEAA